MLGYVALFSGSLPLPGGVVKVSLAYYRTVQRRDAAKSHPVSPVAQLFPASRVVQAVVVMPMKRRLSLHLPCQRIKRRKPVGMGARRFMRHQHVRIAPGQSGIVSQEDRAAVLERQVVTPAATFSSAAHKGLRGVIVGRRRRHPDLDPENAAKSCDPNGKHHGFNCERCGNRQKRPLPRSKCAAEWKLNWRAQQLLQLFCSNPVQTFAAAVVIVSLRTDNDCAACCGVREITPAVSRRVGRRTMVYLLKTKVDTVFSTRVRDVPAVRLRFLFTITRCQRSADSSYQYRERDKKCGRFDDDLLCL